MKQNSKAFTLIEVLVSVTILAIVATGLLQISKNSKQNFQFLSQKTEFERISSIAFMHNDQSLHNSDKSLYDLLSDDYQNLDDDFSKYLKDYTIHYSQEEFSTYSPFSDLNESDENEDESINLTLIYDKILITHKDKSSYVYKIYIPFGDSKSE